MLPPCVLAATFFPHASNELHQEVKGMEVHATQLPDDAFVLCFEWAAAAAGRN